MRPVAGGRWARAGVLGAAGAMALVVAACGDGSDGTAPEEMGPRSGVACELDESLLHDGGVGRNGIPALADPTFVSPDAPGASYLRGDDRVLGLRLGGEHLAVPHNVLWWHEIVNLDRGGESVAVTYCPLTGSTMGFDRSAVGGARFGVSGLLFSNNLIMFDESSRESLWPQMSRQARCGPRLGTELGMIPLLEIRWDRWKELHPEGRVVSAETGFVNNYSLYPYGDYEELDNERTLFPQPDLDPRRPPKERVLGVPDGSGGGVAFPFLALDRRGEAAVARDQVSGEPVVVFWERRGRAAAAYRPRIGDRDLTFEVSGGSIVDRETGSTWRIDGVAVEGPLSGDRLPSVARSYVAFWFAWAAFQPRTRIWTP